MGLFVGYALVALLFLSKSVLGSRKAVLGLRKAVFGSRKAFFGLRKAKSSSSEEQY